MPKTTVIVVTEKTLKIYFWLGLQIDNSIECVLKKFYCRLEGAKYEI